LITTLDIGDQFNFQPLYTPWSLGNKVDYPNLVIMPFFFREPAFILKLPIDALHVNVLV
jgi:hypothetical protein